MGTEHQLGTIADASQYSSGMVGLFLNGQSGLGGGHAADILITEKGVIVFRTGSSGNRYAVADFHCFYSTDGHDRFCQTGIQLFKNRIADSSRKSINDAFDDTSAGVFFIIHSFR